MSVRRDTTNRVRMLGVPVDQINLAGVLSYCREWLQGNTAHQISTVNPEFLVAARKNTRFKEVLNHTELNVADGVGLLYASKLLHGRRGRLWRVTGVELTWELARLCAETGASMYLVGAAKGVAERAAAKMQERYPALQIVGAEEGISKSAPDAKAALESLLGRIYVARPAVLLVAFGAPKQDVWIADHLAKFPSVRIAMGIGGTFDYIAGVMPYAPRWMRSAGLEWLYRLITQPWRLNRIITATVRFPLAVLFHR